MNEALLLVLLIMLMFPFVTYVSVKVGTYAFYRGRELFLKEQEKENGNI